MSSEYYMWSTNKQEILRGKKSFFKTALPFGSALQTLLKEFKFQALLLLVLTLTKILSLQQSYNLRVAPST